MSPSKTGVKAYGYVRASLAEELLGPDRYGRSVTPEGDPANGCEDSGHSKPEIAFYLDRRFFAVTNEAISTRWLQPLDDGLRWLNRRMDRLNGTGARKRSRTTKPPKDTGALPERFVNALATDAQLKRAWESGEKTLDNGGDASASGLDASLVRYLAGRGFSEDEIAAAVRRYEHGQLGSGRLTGSIGFSALPRRRSGQAGLPIVSLARRGGCSRTSPTRWWRCAQMSDGGACSPSTR